MSCSHIQEILSAQLDGETTIAEDQIAALHLGECRTCQAFSEQLESLSFTLLQEAGEDNKFLAPELSVPEGLVRGPVAVVDVKLWLLMLPATLFTLSHTAALLSRHSGGSLSSLLPVALFLLLTPRLARVSRTSSWPRLRAVALLALLSPFLGAYGCLALLFLSALVVRAPRPPEAAGRSYFGWGILAFILAEALARWGGTIDHILSVAIDCAGPSQVVVFQAVFCGVVALAWLAAFGHSAWRIGLLTLTLIATATWALVPLGVDYARYQDVVRKLPPPRQQFWTMCVSVGVVEITTQELERWQGFRDLMDQKPEARAVVKGEIASWEGRMDGRGIVALPWPDLYHNFEHLPSGVVRSAFSEQFEKVEMDVRRRLDGSPSGYLCHRTTPAPRYFYTTMEGYLFSLEVEPGDYALGFERMVLEAPIGGPRWHKIAASGTTVLEQGTYWPQTIYPRPTNLDFARGLEGWDDNETARVLSVGGVEIEPPPFWPRQQGVEQKFAPTGVGGPTVDQVRVTVYLPSAAPHGMLKLSTESRVGDYEMREIATTSPITTLTIPVSPDLGFVQISAEYGYPGPPLRVRGFAVEGLHGDKVLDRVGMVKP